MILHMKRLAGRKYILAFGPTFVAINYLYCVQLRINKLSFRFFCAENFGHNLLSQIFIHIIYHHYHCLFNVLYVESSTYSELTPKAYLAKRRAFTSICLNTCLRSL